MNKVIKAGVDVAKGGIVLTSWVSKIIAIGLVKGVYKGSKTVITVHKRYQLGKKTEKRNND